MPGRPRVPAKQVKLPVEDLLRTFFYVLMWIVSIYVSARPLTHWEVVAIHDFAEIFHDLYPSI